MNPFRRIPEGPKRTAVQAVAVVLLMGSLSWASVPFYDWFCRVTGFGGTTGLAEVAQVEILDETIRIRFVGTVERGMPWSFHPVQNEMELRIGETGMAFYEAHNPTSRPIAGSASYNVAPYDAGGFFIKVDCFCFEQQILQPGETAIMPVQFYVDPDIVDDREGQYIHEISLGYTFHLNELPEDYAPQAALDPSVAGQAPTATN